MLAYEFFLPISAAGFGLGSGISHIWPNGLLVFFVHFAWATMFGIITLIAMRFMPSNLQGLIFTGGVSLVLIVLLLVSDDRRDVVVSLWTGGSESRSAFHLAREPAAGCDFYPCKWRGLFSRHPRRSSTPRLPRPPIPRSRLRLSRLLWK